MPNLFDYIVPEERLHPAFKELAEHPAYNPARNLLRKIFDEFQDLDGNFLEQFQTDGFYSRLWELFLFQYLRTSGIDLIHDHNRPDFHVKEADLEFFIEAVTANSNKSDDTPDLLIKLMEDFKEEGVGKFAQDAMIDHYLIKIASALYSKLTSNKYWQLEWVKDKPLILAIQAVHHKYATSIPDYKLITYLYGTEMKIVNLPNGKQVADYTPLDYHEFTLGNKKIPSGFFRLPDAENISAVLFANTGNSKKFLRHGIQQGFGDYEVFATWAGTKINPNSEFGDEFLFHVDKGEYMEGWADGVSIFHNPNAAVPLPRETFPNTRQLWFTDGKFDGTIMDFQPIHSLTMAFTIFNNKLHLLK